MTTAPFFPSAEQVEEFILREQNVPRPTSKAERLRQEFDLWRDRVGYYLRSKRGLCSQLAADIGVRRQTVWRWFYNRWSNVPGWAAVNVNVWYYSRVPKAIDQELKELQKLGPLGDPRQSVVPRSEDKAVSPQADNIPSLTEDELYQMQKEYARSPGAPWNHCCFDIRHLWRGERIALFNEHAKAA